MKIGYFTNTYLPNEYGSTNSICYFRKGLEKLGHEIYIFAPKFRGYEEQDDHVIRYPSFHWQYKITYPIAFCFYPPMNLIFKKLNLDLIHSQQPFNVGVAGKKFAKKFNLPLIFTYHCRYEDYIHYIPLPFKELVRRYVISHAKKFANQCDQVIAPSSQIKSILQQRGVSVPIEVLSTGINWKKFQQGNREAIREKYGIKKEEVLLLNIGRIEKEKNISFLFNSAVELLKFNNKIKLMMVGDGSEKEQLKRKAQREKLDERIIFSNLVAQKDIADYYAAGDVFIHASLSETQGITINEAMAAGLPIVAVRASGVEDSVESGYSGILTENNQKVFIEEIKKIIKDESQRKILSRNARKTARNFDYITKAQKMEKVYQNLINSAKIKN